MLPDNGRAKMEKFIALFPFDSMEAIGYGSLFRDAEFRSAQVLRRDETTITEILRVAPQRADLLPEEWLAHPLLLSGKFLRREGNDWVVLVTLRLTPAVHELFESFPDVLLGNFLASRKRRMEVCYIGERERLQKFLEKARSLGMPLEVVRFEEFSPKTSGFLEGLTPRQGELLKAAYTLGYFETPRRVKLQDLAEMLDRDPSSVMALLRRAEKRVLDEAFG